MILIGSENDDRENANSVDAESQKDSDFEAIDSEEISDVETLDSLVVRDDESSSVSNIIEDSDSVALDASSNDEVSVTEKGKITPNTIASITGGQLVAVAGYWIGTVPVSIATSGSAVAGFSGGLFSTIALAVSTALFLSFHPFLPYNVKFKTYGFDTIRRRDNRRKSWILEPLRSNYPEKARAISKSNKKYRGIECSQCAAVNTRKR